MSCQIRLMSWVTGCMVTYWATVWAPRKGADFGCCQEGAERLAIQLPQVIRLIISHCPDGTATTKTRHIARVSHHQMIQRRQNAAEPRSWSRQLVNRTIRTGSNERLRSPILLPERFDQYLVHHASPNGLYVGGSAPERVRCALPPSMIRIC